MAFDRYAQFREGNNISVVPFGEVPVSRSDRYEVYSKYLYLNIRFKVK